jgi:acetyl-CoA carboxylase carboxyltransferase component/biotin carboxyl carrier protein
VRDCTVQRRHQKILEEAPSPELSPQEDRALRAAAVRLSRAAHYQNAGTVEFLFHRRTRRFSFIEVNTRLQVEHPVTECTTGLDLVKLQIHIARGGRLEGEPPATVGHAIEVRLNAEDADNGFAPAPGTIERFRIARGPGIRVDAGVAEGDSIAPEFDSMIAKIIAYGQNRKEALSRLQRALGESVVVIKGGTSNKAFLLDLLSRGEVQRGEVDTGWLDRRAAARAQGSRQYAEIALIQAAIEAYGAQLAIEQADFYASAYRLRPDVRCEAGRKIALRYRGHSYSLRICKLGRHQYRVETEGARVDVQIQRLSDYEYWLTAFDQRFRVVLVSCGTALQIEVNGVSHRVERDDQGMVRSPSPAVVVSIAVKPGDFVRAGDAVAVLEAMKMEMQVVAPCSGRVRQVFIVPYVQVGAGSALVQIGPESDDDQFVAAERAVFGASFASEIAQQTAEVRCRGILTELRQMMLGFDVDPERTSVLLSDWEKCCAEATDDAGLLKLEEEILSTFVDICSLFERDPQVQESTVTETPSAEANLFMYLRTVERRGEGLPARFVESLTQALNHYGVQTLDPSPELAETMIWIYKSHKRIEQQINVVVRLLEKALASGESSVELHTESFRPMLDRIIGATREAAPIVSDLARELRYRCFDLPLLDGVRRQIYVDMEGHLDWFAAHPSDPDYEGRTRALIDCPQPLMKLFFQRFDAATQDLRRLMLEVLTHRFYRIRALENVHSFADGQQAWVTGEYEHEGKRIHLFATHSPYDRLAEATRELSRQIAIVGQDADIVVDLYLSRAGELEDADTVQMHVQSTLNAAHFSRPLRRIVVALARSDGNHDGRGVYHFTYRPSGETYEEERVYRGVHPMIAKRLHFWRLKNFSLQRFPAADDVYLLRAVAHDNPKDVRLIACAEVRDMTPVRDESGRVVQLPDLERMFTETLAGMRRSQSKLAPQERLYWNRILLYVWPPMTLTTDELKGIVHGLAPMARGAGLDMVVVRGRIPVPGTGELRDMVVRISMPTGNGVVISFRPASSVQPLKTLSEYDQKVLRMRRRGLVYPYEIIKMMTPGPQDMHAEFPSGDFVEYDLDRNGRLTPVDRPYGRNTANVIVGAIRNYTAKHPEGMTRIILFGDPSKDLGALAEPECRRIIAALDVAQEMGVPVEWFPISAGAKISMESGVENMDWIARVLRRLIEFTQSGGEVNLVVNGINVGAQPYWNAEATMLMHTRGILIMTSKAAMVLTGKRALDYSGSVSAEDNQGIGGYDRIMGPNGQAQYWAGDIDEGCRILLRHYEHTYVAPGERFPRRAATSDAPDRNVCLYPMTGDANGFTNVGDIFSDEKNPGRKKPFDIRKVITAVVDQDHTPLERWAGMRAAETAVVYDAHLGGYPVCVIGIESRPLARFGFVPADGPEQWCAGTLFPFSSKKVARAINTASNNRPVVVLANLSGFDGSPESMRKLQLEYGAEIGRAVVNFKGPLIFCVISRYHGGAYVVFSRVLNENLQAVALEGAYASVIGGAPAAAVVFASEVEARARKDARLTVLSEAISRTAAADNRALRAEYNEVFKRVHSEKLGEVADEFDRVHNIQRARQVGALDDIVPPPNLRPYLIAAVERGIRTEEQRIAAVATKFATVLITSDSSRFEVEQYGERALAATDGR